MAVEAFLPGSTDAKITVEKEVREKPKLSELTTIERPGRPMPASELENPEPKKKAVRKKAAKAPASQLEYKRDATLVITEKPQAALKIASALGSARKYAENGVPFYEVSRGGKKLIVVSAVGHLFNLTYEEGQRGWPVFKTRWVPAFDKAAFTKKYYDVIKKMARRANEVIVATDYDVEGEVIGWNVVRFIAERSDAKRMKFSTLTKDELERSYDEALPTIDWSQAYAGEARHEVDWLYGINLSRALMSAIKTSGSFKILSIGRIQGPALKIIVDREREIAAFKPEPYWQVFAMVKGLELKHTKDIFDKNELEAFKHLKEGIAETKTRDESVSPPYPFDLTSLQREAYAWHKINPSQTLKLAQSLYLDGLISYPRTSSQKIPKAIEPRKIINKLAAHFPVAKEATRVEPVEGPKSDPAHPSIYPTGEFAYLEGEEKKVYELIVKRFLAAFAPDALLSRTTIKLTAEGKDFTRNGTLVKDKGWMKVYPAIIEEESLPALEGKQTIDEVKFVEKETQPPKRYTPTSLITILEKKNLGTKTTRSLIIDTLFDRGYLEGKSIQATSLGMRLIESLEKYSPIIIDEQLTGNLETKMEDILASDKQQEAKKDAIVAEVKSIITKIAAEFKPKEAEIGAVLKEGLQEAREQEKVNSIIMPCPLCKQGNLVIKFAKKTRRYFAACDRYPACTATHSLPPNALIRKTDKLSPEGLPILIALRKGKRPWEFVFNPNYKKDQASTSSKDSEE